MIEHQDHLKWLQDGEREAAKHLARTNPQAFAAQGCLSGITLTALRAGNRCLSIAGCARFSPGVDVRKLKSIFDFLRWYLPRLFARVIGK